MFKKMKLSVLATADLLGVSGLILNSSWRRQKLLILCYHGISLEDEHRWDPSLYMSPELLRERFEYLKKVGCHLLPFGEAVRALYEGELPAKAVSITFDDGFFDFYRHALPIATEFHFPVTVYLTTYYSYYNRPVFDAALNYILWKGRGRELQMPEALPAPVALNADTIRAVADQLYSQVTRLGYSGKEKDEFLQRLCRSLGVDFEEIRRKRILHLMTPSEVAEAAAGGADVQLHTHRHRVSGKKQQFQQEIFENRGKIEQLTHSQAKHFCYPSGFFMPEYPEWLRDAGVESATTCIPGLATASSSLFLLPRLLDSSTTTASEFAGWVSGLAGLLPRRKFVMDDRSYLQDGPATPAN